MSTKPLFGGVFYLEMNNVFFPIEEAKVLAEAIMYSPTLDTFTLDGNITWHIKGIIFDPTLAHHIKT